mmetsp:Transcript_40494/g.53114  ORF Transcript_40494/g.53114 Transcript_40494/m.53114 type:complete len:80 (+) Transcript_40494:196-435(+)
MLIEEPNSTEESQHDTSQPGSKFKNIMNIAKRKFKSKSQVPSNVTVNKQAHNTLERDAAHSKAYNQKEQQHTKGSSRLG